MNELRLPEQLTGAWDHVLILTYGADLPFFENALWSQLASCRNKIILVDGAQYLTHCLEWTGTGALRFLNQRYVAEGVFAPHAAHAKMILLTNQKAGRLLVGSGNLGLNGYASGGELFTQYDYTVESPGQLGAFLSAWQLVEGLLARGYVTGAQARRRIDYLLEHTPWLLGSAADAPRPVRHNLAENFLAQLSAVVGDREVEDLWILSPFFDSDAVALDRMLAALQPRRATILVQPGATSVEPASLQRVLEKHKGRCEMRPVSRGDGTPYIHAKLYLVKLRDSAVCLQGSPNLSQAAMLLTVPQGNIELANLVEAPRDAFDHLFAAMHIGPPATHLSELDLSLDPFSSLPAQLNADWQLLGGEWQDDRLRLQFWGNPPDLTDAELIIGGIARRLDVISQQDGLLQVHLSNEEAGLLGRGLPVALRWREGGQAHDTNPVFVCNQATLEQELAERATGEALPRIGSLDLDDAEFESLLVALESTVVIDRRGLWELAGQRLPASTGENDDAPPLDYLNVDYELLRRHPRIQQYIAMRTGASYRPTRLQIILNAIVDHFRVMLATPAGTSEPPITAGIDEIGGETEEESERNAKERQRRRQSVAQRTERILKSFIRRYLRGLRSPDFQKAAGYEVMVHNYSIFSYLLWRLFAKTWVAPEFLVESLLETWSFFWGNLEQTGYYWKLSEEEQALAKEWLCEQYGDGHLLAAMTWSASIVAVHEQQELRFALRDFWRAFLAHAPFQPTVKALEVAWRSLAVLRPYASPLPTQIVGDLARLADFETRDSFLRTMERRYRCPVRSWRFAKASVARESFVDGISVDCVVLPLNGALASQSHAMKVLQAWMRWDSRDYYRLASPDCNNAQELIFFDRTSGYGIYRVVGSSSGPVEFESVPVTAEPWDATLAQLQAKAIELESQIALPIEREQAQAVRTGAPVSATAKREDVSR